MRWSSSSSMAARRRSSCAWPAPAGRRPSTCLPAMTGWCWSASCPGSREYLRASVDYDGISPAGHGPVQPGRAARACAADPNWWRRRRSSAVCRSCRVRRAKSAACWLPRAGARVRAVPPRATRNHARPDPRALIGYVECNKDGEDGQVLSDYDLIGSEAGRSRRVRTAGRAAFNFLYLPPPARDRDLGMSALVVGARFCRRASCDAAGGSAAGLANGAAGAGWNARLAVPQRGCADVLSRGLTAMDRLHGPHGQFPTQRRGRWPAGAG